MSGAADDPRCPECGEPIGQTATYCMHCSADLTAERAAADTDGDGVWDQTEEGSSPSSGSPTGYQKEAPGSGWAARISGRKIADTLGFAVSGNGKEGGQLLAPDGLVDNMMTVVVGIIGGFIIGMIGTVALGVLTESVWGLLLGVIIWLGATAYLVRRQTVQDAIAKSGYGSAAVMLFVPLIAISPTVSVDGGLAERGGVFLALLMFMAIPAGIAAFIGWIASRFVSETSRKTDA